MPFKQKVADIQKILGTEADGLWGKKTQTALETLLYPTLAAEMEHHGKASSFADPADVAAFKKWFTIYLGEGLSEERATKRAFAKGDNAIGRWGDSTAEGTGPSCALPPEDMAEKWGGVTQAKHKLVEVTANDKTVTCVLKDRMPYRANITNQAIIDLNPDAVRALGLEPPIMITASWRWT